MESISVAVDAKGQPVQLDEDRGPIQLVDGEEGTVETRPTGVFYVLTVRGNTVQEVKKLEVKTPGNTEARRVLPETLPPQLVASLNEAMLRAISQTS